MAVGDKIYLADKQTLDETKSNTETIKASLASTNSKLDLMDTKVSTKAEQSTVNTIDANVKTANTNINTLNTKVGVNNDAAGTTTVFARLKQIYDYLAGTILTAINGRQANWGATSTHAERIDANISSRQANWGATTTHRDRIDTTISSRASQATVNTINSNVNSIKSFTDRGMVKSVQRGVFTSEITLNNNDGKEHDTPYKEISISPVNVAKAFVLINGSVVTNSNGYIEPNIRLMDSTTLRIYSMKTTDFGVLGNWQVIEFY